MLKELGFWSPTVMIVVLVCTECGLYAGRRPFSHLDFDYGGILGQLPHFFEHFFTQQK